MTFRHGLLRSLGALLLASPFVAGALGTYVETSGGEWLLGIVVFATVAGLVAWFVGDWSKDGVHRLATAWRRPSLRTASLAAGAILASILIFVSWGVFRYRPLLVDSVAQLFQARIFLTGSLQVPVPPIPAFWDTMHMIVDADGWYAQYPPGHAALLALGASVGASWLVPVILSMGTFVALVAFARRAYGDGVAKGTAVLLVACPFFWFMGASFMNHVPALFGAAVVLYGVARWEEEGHARWLALAGAAAGFGFLARPLTMVAFSIPLVAVILGRAIRRREFRPLVAGMAAFVPFPVAYLAFNAGTTGHPLVTGYTDCGAASTAWGSTPRRGARSTRRSRDSRTS